MLPSEAEFPSALADSYAQYLAPAVYETWAGEIVQLAKPQQGDTILDIGCKTGLLAFKLAKLTGPSGLVVGIEANHALLKVAQRVRAALDLTNVGLKSGEYSMLPYPDEVFDRVVCMHELSLIPHKVAVLKEMYRVLSRGGRLVITAHGSRKGNPHEALLAEAFRNSLPGEPPYFAQLFSLGELAGLEVTLLDAGLRAHAVVERVRRVATFTTPEGFWQGMVYGTRLRQVLMDQPRETQAAIKNNTLAKMEAYRSAAGYTVPIEAVVATLAKP